MRQLTTIFLAGLLAVLPFSSQYVAPRDSVSGQESDHGFSTSQNSLTQSPCADAIAHDAVCTAANKRALEIMNSMHLEAFTVVQDVRTGALIAFAASQPNKLDVTTAVLPLSVMKLLLAASWWDNGMPDSTFDSYRGPDDQRPRPTRLISVHEMLVNGSDNAGREMALFLRRVAGTESVLGDFKRYGFSPVNAPVKENFWAELDPALRRRLTPMTTNVSLGKQTKDSEWADTLSIGEANVKVTGLQISRFLQAIGNGGIMIAPRALAEQRTRDRRTRGRNAEEDLRERTVSPRVRRKTTALRLQSAMREAVQRGTAKSIARALAEARWEMGGKTGTGPGPAPIGPHSDGWFAGLVFDPQLRARFTMATFVRHGGTGGGNAAKVSAELARFIIGANSFPTLISLRG